MNRYDVYLLFNGEENDYLTVAAVSSQNAFAAALEKNPDWLSIIEWKNPDGDYPYSIEIKRIL